MLTKEVFIALGSNVGDREQYLCRAIHLLDCESSIKIIKQSTFIETEPVGPIEQRSFLNGVIEIETSLSPRKLLDTCLQIEDQLGRIRKQRWGPRTIDLDIILFGEQCVKEDHLKIPHPELLNRLFVLEPLAEISPHVLHPENGLKIVGLLRFQK